MSKATLRSHQSRKKTFLYVNGMESIFAELTTTDGIIVVGLLYKHIVDIRSANISVALLNDFSTLKKLI